MAQRRMFTLSVLVLVLSTVCQVYTTHLNLGEEGVSVEWGIDDRGGSQVMKLLVKLPEPFTWLAVGFHGVPFQSADWEDLAMISIATTPEGKQLSYLNTLHVDANDEVFKSKVPLYRWPSIGGRKKVGRTYYFTVERDLKMIQVCSPVRLVWNYGVEHLSVNALDPQLFRSKQLLLNTGATECGVDQPNVEEKNEESNDLTMNPAFDQQVEVDRPVVHHLPVKAVSVEQPHVELEQSQSVQPKSNQQNPVFNKKPHIKSKEPKSQPPLSQHSDIKADKAATGSHSDNSPLTVSHKSLIVPPSTNVDTSSTKATKEIPPAQSNVMNGVMVKSEVKDSAEDSTIVKNDKSLAKDAAVVVSKVETSGISVAHEAETADSKVVTDPNVKKPANVDKIPEATKVDKVPVNVGKVDKVPVNVVKVNKVPLNIAKVAQVPLNIAKVTKVPPKVEKVDKVPQTVVKVDKVPQTVAKVDKVPETVAKVDKVPQEVAKVEKVPETVVIEGTPAVQSSEKHQEHCLKACTKEYEPICGSDGETYGNKCTFEIGRCENPSLKEKHEGECEDLEKREDLKSMRFVSQLYVDMNLDDLETSLRQKNQSVINEYYRKLKQVVNIVEKVKGASSRNIANKTTTDCHCPPDESHWFDFFKNNEDSVYFAVIGISAFFTGAIVLCLACCCARRSTKAAVRNIRKSKVSFYKVDDFESSADEVEEFLGDDEADDDLKNLVKGSHHYQ